MTYAARVLALRVTAPLPLPPLAPVGECVWVGVDALADLDSHDPRLLLDGSCWVDAAALTEVSRHLGGNR